ncbi:YbaB/EbfC family nucleoid-associated protein [Nocardia testacea]|uniref:YbaB/EbfC family nucleoid-associated protein n=1 Tax=Nocardia testacea TaxID=248551 RepID=UPI000304EB29|nr:YbaB/EbfC family nucleoid-associated protein [Nocardia testacea]
MSEAMDALEARVNRQLNLMRDLGNELSAIRVRETSPDGAITVEVDGNTKLRDLSFTEAIAEMTPHEFESAVVATAGRAAHLAIAQRAELVNAFNSELAETAADGGHRS